MLRKFPTLNGSLRLGILGRVWILDTAGNRVNNCSCPYNLSPAKKEIQDNEIQTKKSSLTQDLNL
jgi:hypothetical protein